MRQKVGVVTIGQSPRTDILREMLPLLGKNIDICERGALDGLDLDQVKNFLPEGDMMPFCTRMNDGSEVIVAKEKILSKVEQSIDALNKERVSLIILLCVGPFPSFDSSCLVLQPQNILNKCVEGLIGEKHHLGIVVPVNEQETWAHQNFSHITPQITVTTVSPYGDRRDILRTSQILKSARCDLIVMYCMGFTNKLSREVRTATGKPVILASSMVARTAGELLREY